MGGEQDAMDQLTDVLKKWRGSISPTMENIGDDLCPAVWLLKSYQTLGPQELSSSLFVVSD
jgi:hypothetical protein